MKDNKLKNKFDFLNRNIQEYIYLSYLYLLILGTLSYSIFYAFLGINIISYSSLIDILLSPISSITNNVKIPILIIIVIGFCILLYYLLEKRTKKKLEKNPSPEKEIKLKKQYKKYKKQKILTPILGVLGFYLGFSIGGGQKLHKKIQNGNFKIDRILEFSNGETKKVKLIGTNSQYIFYAVENEKKVSITPISGNIKTIKYVD